MYIVIAIIMFGLLIAGHELGHFSFAKLLGVKVNEFAIGMGPKIISKQGKETLYSLRAIPMGGFCAMEGEDSENEDPRAFTSAARWKRALILIAGSLFNLLIGFIVVLLLFSQAKGFVGNTLASTAPGFPNAGEDGFLPGDKIISIDGERVWYAEDFTQFLSLRKAGKVTADIVIVRNGEKIRLPNFPMAAREYTENGETRVRYGLTFSSIKATPGEKLRYSAYSTYNFLRLTKYSLVQLLTGNVGVNELSGPVGIVSAINTVGTSSDSVKENLMNVAYFIAFIAINLAFMNMLPIPALDGGRVLFLVLTGIIETITHKHINPKYEGYIHAGAMVLLFGLMGFTFINDIVKLVVN